MIIYKIRNKLLYIVINEYMYQARQLSEIKCNEITLERSIIYRNKWNTWRDYGLDIDFFIMPEVYSFIQ